MKGEQKLYSWIIKVLKRITPQSLKNIIKRHILKRNSNLGSAGNQAIETKVDDVAVLLQQVLSILHHELNIPLPPPKYLQERVVGGYFPDFIESGFTSIYPTLNRVLKPTGKELRSFMSVLDFGCGCGRAVRALATLLPACKLYGTDIDGEAIEWLKRHYPKYAEFSVAPHVPPTIFEDQKFDLVLASLHTCLRRCNFSG